MGGWSVFHLLLVANGGYPGERTSFGQYNTILTGLKEGHKLIQEMHEDDPR